MEKCKEVIVMRELFVEKVIDLAGEFLDNNQRIKLKEIPFSRTFETGNGEELCNATGYAVQFDNEKTPLGFPLFWNEFQDREGNLYYGN